MKEKVIRSISMELVFECGGRASAVIDYRSIKPDIAVLSNSTSTIFGFMLESSGMNSRDQLPLFNSSLPIEDISNNPPKILNPFHIKENWVNLRKRRFIRFISEHFPMIKSLENETVVALDKKFMSFFEVSLFTFLGNETGQSDIVQMADMINTKKETQ